MSHSLLNVAHRLRAPALFLSAGALLAAVGCGPTNTSRTEYHERIDTTTGGAPGGGMSGDPNAGQQNAAPPPIIEERRSAPETIVQ